MMTTEHGFSLKSGSMKIVLAQNMVLVLNLELTNLVTLSSFSSNIFKTLSHPNRKS